MDGKDRRTALLQSSTLNGIDFVEIADDSQTALRVHFLSAVAVPGSLAAPPTITGGETIRTVVVDPVADTALGTPGSAWSLDGDHLVLALTVAAPGDFANYTLALASTKLDPFFQSAVFSFKARCPSDLDWQAAAAVCPPLTTDVPPIEYLAKDFLSFRQALLDFSALRYPEWQERSEADFGLVFLEALSALADDLSYTQDRVAAEIALDTATQRRSLVRLARLVDYEPQPAIAAATMLQVDVGAGITAVAPGLAVSAQGPDGTPISFETGTGLNDTTTPGYTVNSKWNRQQADGTIGLQPYIWDDSQNCLPAGATEMWVLGTGLGLAKGQTLLLETTALSSADAPIREFVLLSVEPDETVDPLYPFGSSATTPLTHLVWGPGNPLQFNHDLTADASGAPRTIVVGNIIPSTQAVRQTESFAIPSALVATPPALLAIVRTGPNDTPAAPSLQFLYTLANTPVAWLQPADPTVDPLPEIVLVNRGADPTAPAWGFVRRLLDAGQFDNAFTLDAARYTAIARNSDGSTQYDYDGDAGDTIRFGDGTFAVIPADGAIFDVTYRVSAGAAGNVAADAITQVAPAGVQAGVLAVTNPFPATGGADVEPFERVRRLAPQEFRAVQFRAVLPVDYEDAAQTLPWVQRAGTVFRWTGSWLTVSTTADPLASEQITSGQRTDLIELLNRYRLAGYESYVPEARYVSLDLAVEVCALADSFQGDVEAAVLATLGTTGAGFFNPDNFTFGQSLERSALETAIQNAAGVAGVTCIRYRVRERTAALVEMSDVVAVATDEIIRCDNDLSAPGNGSLKVTVRGGK